MVRVKTFRPIKPAIYKREWSNKAPAPTHTRPSLRDQIIQSGHMADLCLTLFPNAQLEVFRFGEKVCRVLRTGDMYDSPGRSADVYLDDGQFTDRNGGEKMDVVEVLKLRFGLDNRETFKWLQSNGYLSVNSSRNKASYTTTINGSVYEPQQLGRLDAAPIGTPAPTTEQLKSMINDPLIDSLIDPVAHVYIRADNRAVMFVARYFLIGNKKRIYRGVWDSDKSEWRLSSGGATSNKTVPLYRLPEILASNKPVLLVEGEKAADSGAVNPDLSNFVVSCPLGGSNPSRHTDWSPLDDRTVLVLGDHDDAGRSFTKNLVALLGDTSDVHAVDPVVMYERLAGAGDPPVGWDIADVRQTAPSFEDEPYLVPQNTSPDAAAPLDDQCSPVCDAKGLALRHYCQAHFRKPISNRGLDRDA